MNNVSDKFKEVCHIFNVDSAKQCYNFLNRKSFWAKVLNEDKGGPVNLTGQLRTMRRFENAYIQKDVPFCRPKNCQRKDIR